jgi:hypothetical protein
MAMGNPPFVILDGKPPFNINGLFQYLTLMGYPQWEIPHLLDDFPIKTSIFSRFPDGKTW